MNAASEEPGGPAWFSNVTHTLGLDFIHDAGPAGTYFMPQQVGSGAALFDFNNDGLLDLYLLQNAGPEAKATNRLYRQMPTGTFKDVSAGSHLDIAGHNMGVAVGDVNNDGWPDVLVTQFRGARLFLNRGDGSFSDVTTTSGIENPAWATSASFFDYDRDGWLDLIVVNYLSYDPSLPCYAQNGLQEFCAPRVFPGVVSRLYHNLGADPQGQVKFQDVTLASGLGRLPGPGLGVICADFNADGWTDIFVANDGQPNRLWINRHDGTFSEEATRRGVGVNAMGNAEANMGVALADVDSDGLFDLFVTHLNVETNTLWKQERPGLFRDQTAASGLARPRWRATGFSTALADFDQDGLPDIVIANGRIARGTPFINPELGPFWKDYGDRNQVFHNAGQGRFVDISLSNSDLCGVARVCRGVAVGDIDNDGALDLVVTAIAGSARIYRNVAPDRGHWLQVRALDPALKRDALGAEVTVKAGDKHWWRLITNSAGYLCASDARAHFGLGSITHIDAIEVAWPDGKKESFPGGAVDRHIILHKGQGH